MLPADFSELIRNSDTELLHMVRDTFVYFHLKISGSNGTGFRGLFQSLGLLNHACAPNAELTWEQKTRRAVLRATKTMLVDDLIFISYIDQFNRRDQRHLDLRFECCCPLCILTGQDQIEKEDMVEEMSAAFRAIDAFQLKHLPSPRQKMEPADDQCDAIDCERSRSKKRPGRCIPSHEQRGETWPGT